MTSLFLPPELVGRLRAARHVAVLTGAGISAESGLPTFRDAMTGLWAQYRPEDLATSEAFQRDPRLVWEWYLWRRMRAEQAAPNPAHRALTVLEQRVPRLTLMTQNVDGLHQRAGSTQVIELHGSLRRVRCSQEGVIAECRPEADTIPPRCPRCGGLLRPDVVWFGEPLPQRALKEAADAAAQCDLFLSIGTSGLVEPAASLPRLAATSGAAVAIVNPEATNQRAPGIYGLKGPAGQILPALLHAAWPEAPP